MRSPLPRNYEHRCAVRLLCAALLAILPMYGWAGGTAFACRYDSFTDEGDGRFQLILQALESPDVAVAYTEDHRLVLHIQYSSRNPLPSGRRPVSRHDFDAAISRIRADLKAGVRTRFGILGAALREIKGRPGHYRVYGLRLEDEQNPEKPEAPLVVYAY